MTAPIPPALADAIRALRDVWEDDWGLDDGLYLEAAVKAVIAFVDDDRLGTVPQPETAERARAACLKFGHSWYWTSTATIFCAICGDPEDDA